MRMAIFTLSRLGRRVAVWPDKITSVYEGKGDGVTFISESTSPQTTDEGEIGGVEGSFDEVVAALEEAYIDEIKMGQTVNLMEGGE